MTSNQRILVAVDGSQASRRSVAYVADMIGGRPSFHVGLVHLELPPRMLEWGGSEDNHVEGDESRRRAREYGEMEKEAVENVQALLKRSHALLAGMAIDVIAEEVRFTEPLDAKHIARDTLKMAKERGYGTIVVGRHSFAGLKRLFGHHVGEELVRTGEGVTIWVVE